MRQMTEKNLRDAFAGESQAHMRYLIYASKAGGAIGPRATYKVLYHEYLGQEGAHFVAVTDAGFGLHHEATEKGFTVVPTKDNIGGRFSVMAPEMLVPAASTGRPVQEVLETLLNPFIGLQRLDFL